MMDMQQLQKDISNLRSETEEVCSKLANQFGVCLKNQSALSGGLSKIQQGLDTFNNLLNKLTEKVETHVDEASSFKAQVVKHQVNTKTEGINMQKEMKKMNEQLDGMNSKCSNEKQEANQLKEQLAGLNKKLLNEQQATEKLRAQVDAMEDRFVALNDKLEQVQIKGKNIEIEPLQQPSFHATAAHQVPEWVLHERKKNNIIIFGLEETEDDQALIESLFNDLGIPFATISDACGIYRVVSGNN